MEQKELITTDGFINVFIRNTNKYRTQVEAYEATEAEYQKMYNVGRRYASFDSFRQVKNRRAKVN